ncbi:uncharacterized protein LOC121875116 isoform X1 [Homarus americanus]|uniref:uncharacterized protein LOC121875116 isoform X1 n=1 Tax=Homarus americanus TaxID=6706 RepID=UPI001C475A73|nr:uncharacterized protein LOC121875116 isoform X1 [Homarus americanus]
MWKMWVVVVTVVMAVVTAEKLGDIEVITRGELGQEQFLPPGRTRLSTLVPVGLNPPNQVQNNPPPLSYLPPVQTPLPIEPTAAQQEVVAPDGLYQVPQNAPSVVQQPTGLFFPPDTHETINSGTAHQPAGAFSPTAGVSVGLGGGTDDVGNYGEPYIGPPLVEDYDEDTSDGFLTGLQDSKFTILGGVLGAKAAVAQGFKDAQTTFVASLTDAIASKSAAFSSLKSKSTSSEGSYTDSSEEDYQGVGVGGGPIPGVSGGVYPVSTPSPVTPYPIYPPYPQPVYPQPVYPQSIFPMPIYPLRPMYRPKLNLFTGIKAKVEGFKSKVGGIVGAKKEVLAGALAKVGAVKEELKDKISSVFRKGPITYQTYPTYPTYPHTHPTYPQTHPTYPQTHPTYPQTDQTYSQTHPTYPQTHPTYSQTHPISYGSGKTQLDAKKQHIFEAIAGAFAKLKTPFHTLHPVYPQRYYGRRPW